MKTTNEGELGLDCSIREIEIFGDYAWLCGSNLGRHRTNKPPTKLSGQANAAATNSDNPGSTLPGRCRPGLSVPDLAWFHKRMLEFGVPCAQEPKDVFGSKIAQYVDPDGLVISVAEEA